MEVCFYLHPNDPIIEVTIDGIVCDDDIRFFGGELDYRDISKDSYRLYTLSGEEPCSIERCFKSTRIRPELFLTFTATSYDEITTAIIALPDTHPELFI